MRDFVEKWSNIDIAINFHCFGNLFIVPFNYDPVEGNKNLAENFTDAKNFYDNVYENGGVPEGSKMGNGLVTVNYDANGEASDWFLGDEGIYSISPELGTSDPERSFGFALENKEDV